MCNALRDDWHYAVSASVYECLYQKYTTSIPTIWSAGNGIPIHLIVAPFSRSPLAPPVMAKSRSRDAIPTDLMNSLDWPVIASR